MMNAEQAAFAMTDAQGLLKIAEAYGYGPGDRDICSTCDVLSLLTVRETDRGSVVNRLAL